METDTVINIVALKTPQSAYFFGRQKSLPLKIISLVLK